MAHSFTVRMCAVKMRLHELGLFLDYSIQTRQDLKRRVLSTVMMHFWFKSLGTMGFIMVFFTGYIYLLRHPAYPVAIMPVTMIDRFITFEPLALPFYLSLWVYVSLPPMLMRTRREIIEYGWWIGCMCLAALAIFYFWPSAIPSTKIDWARYPGVAFLKGMDATGNACPSLHVATAVFSAFWLHRRLPTVGLGNNSRLFSACWCIAIIYSTMATKQHMAVDVIAGIGFASAFMWYFLKIQTATAGVSSR